MQIVAPAGSIAGLKASINGGADAVYLGMSQFGARAKAENFDGEAFKTAVEYAHLYGVKVFVTLNTLIKDREMRHALELAEFACKNDVDAAIVQDLRFIKQLKKTLPELTLHASTQMGIHNKEGALSIIDLGIKRAVLARETLPQDIADIKSTGIEIEYFVQGALCISFSGNCYFSSLASSYSGNRGKCMQLCRKPYVFRGNRGYWLSAKDLCLYDRLQMLRSLGVDAVKIEGRMRSEEYAYTAVDVYKNAPDVENAVKLLKSVFNRGDYCTGYLDADAPFRVIYPQIQSNMGVPVDKISQISGKTLYVNGFTPHNADGYKVIRNGEEVCGAAVKNGNITADGNCKVGDELRKTFDGALSEKIKKIDRKIDVEVDIKVGVGKPLTAELCVGDIKISVSSNDITQQAVTRGMTENDLRRAFEKVSEYPFNPTIRTQIFGDAFMPVSALNDFRRKAYASLKQAVLDNYKIKRSAIDYKGLAYNKFDGCGKILMVQSIEQLTAEIISAIDYIALDPTDYSSFDIPKTDKPILLNAPITMRGDDRNVIKSAIERDGIYGVISNNPYTLKLTNKPILLGIGHNIIGETDLPHIRSVEADCNTNGFEYVFGYAPVMTLCHCPYQKCINCDGRDSLTDENGRRFALRRYKTAHCYWQLLNCNPHFTVDKALENGVKNMFFDCTAVDKDIISKVIRGRYDGKYTRGNINKGLK